MFGASRRGAAGIHLACCVPRELNDAVLRQLPVPLTEPVPNQRCSAGLLATQDHTSRLRSHRLRTPQAAPTPLTHTSSRGVTTSFSCRAAWRIQLVTKLVQPASIVPQPCHT